jgi:hypothetical protein
VPTAGTSFQSFRSQSGSAPSSQSFIHNFITNRVGRIELPACRNCEESIYSARYAVQKTL